MLWREPPPFGGREQRALRDAEEGVVRLVVRAGCEIGLVGRHKRQADPVGKVDQRRLGGDLGVAPVALQFDVEPVPEGCGEALEARLARGRACERRAPGRSAPAGPPVSAMRPSAPRSASNGICASSPSVGSSQTEETSRISVR